MAHNLRKFSKRTRTRRCNNDSDLLNLVAMGFATDDSAEALFRTKGDAKEAMSMLIEGMTDLAAAPKPLASKRKVTQQPTSQPTLLPTNPTTQPTRATHSL